MDKNYFDEQGKRNAENWLLFIHSLIDECRFSPRQFRVLCHVARRAGFFSESCGSKETWAGVRSMAETCQMSVGTLRKTLAELVFLRVLKRKSRGAREADLYYINPRRVWAPPGTVELTDFGPDWNNPCAE